jgi:beta-galactosidase
MLDHQGRKDSTYDETAEVFAELTRLAPIIDATRFVASAAVLYSDEIGWAWNHIVSERLRSVMARCDISTQGHLLRWYTPLYQAKVSVDVLDPLRDLSAYGVVLAPNLYLIQPEIVANLERYVRGGGALIVGPKAGLKDWNNVFYADLPPCAGLSEILGTTVKPAPFRLGRAEMPVKRVTMEHDAPFGPGVTFENEGLFDDLDPVQARIVARHETGEAAVTVNAYGRGWAMYVGCQPEQAFYRQLVAWLIDSGKLEPALRTDADVEVTVRVGGGYRLIFILNHNPGPAQIALDREYLELISDRPVSGVMVVEGQGVRILADKEGSNEPTCF